MRSPIRSLRRKLGRARDFTRYLRDYREFRRQQEGGGGGTSPPLRWGDRYPILGEWTKETGFDPHYVYHPAWAARILAETRPAEHVDISSTVYFAALVSAFVPLRFYDYRPARLKLPGLTCDRADLLALPFESGSLPSISCMHVVEHVGLGRYGDPVDADGDRKAMRELARVVAPGGDLLLAVPVGRARVQFNAHRIYSYDAIVGSFDGFELVRFDLIPDDAEAIANGMIAGASSAQVDAQRYGCGCFWFRRRA